jgi:hypothetical protein
VRNVCADNGSSSRPDEAQHGRHNIGQGHHCLDLVIGHSPQQTHDGIDLVKDVTELRSRR